MRENDCYRCKYGDVSDKPRTVTFGNSVFHQSGGGVICCCPKVETITLIGDSFQCSSFVERSGGGNDVD